MRVLVADDEGIIRMGLKTMLQDLGHEVITALNGREAIQMAQRHNPDLAILDIKMPYTDGLQATKTISRINPMPILMLTAYSQRDLIEQAADLPVQGYLIKPIKREELDASITIAVKRFIDMRLLQERVEKLEQSLHSRKLLDRAKGQLMAQGMSEQDAYLALQRQARTERISLGQAAQQVLDKKQ